MLQQLFAGIYENSQSTDKTALSQLQFENKKADPSKKEI